MKIKVVIVILAVACVGLGIALFATKKSADDQHATDAHSIDDFSNQVVTASRHLDELGQVNLTLSNDLTSSQQQLSLTADQLAQVSNSLVAASATLADTQTSLVAEQELVTNLNNRISELEAQNRSLDAQVIDLTNTLTQLTAQIEDTRNQLAVSETNRVFLQDELKKQLAAKAELEHKFNDLDALRGQVKKIKDEMFVARHILLMKNDNGGKKGATMLMQHDASATGQPTSNPPANYNLNVEVGSDGTVKVIPPLESTNSATGSETNGVAH